MPVVGAVKPHELGGAGLRHPKSHLASAFDQAWEAKADQWLDTFPGRVYAVLPASP